MEGLFRREEHAQLSQDFRVSKNLVKKCLVMFLGPELPRRRFDYKKFCGCSPGDELVSWRSTSIPWTIMETGGGGRRRLADFSVVFRGADQFVRTSWIYTVLSVNSCLTSSDTFTCTAVVTGCCAISAPAYTSAGPTMTQLTLAEMTERKLWAMMMTRKMTRFLRMLLRVLSVFSRQLVQASAQAYLSIGKKKGKGQGKSTCTGKGRYPVRPSHLSLEDRRRDWKN